MEFKKYIFVLPAIILLAGILVLFFVIKNKTAGKQFFFSGSGNSSQNFLEESSSMKKSLSADWWLNSGGVMDIGRDNFSTNMGKLSDDNKWRKAYSKNNPTDTDNGYLPQNIFRLASRSLWKNFSQEVYFQIKNINLTDSPNRNESNGVLLFNRYTDGDNLYYAGLRVDGDAVIKKKIGGKYYTMAEANIFSNSNGYDQEKNPNVLPLNQWLGIKTVVENTPTGVDIKLFYTAGENSDWKVVLEKTDDGSKYGKSPFLSTGYAGIRTDFMDVMFKNYQIIEK